MHPRDYRVAMFVVLGVMVVWGYLISPFKGNSNRSSQPYFLAFRFDPRVNEIQWIDDWSNVPITEPAPLRRGAVRGSIPRRANAGFTMREIGWTLQPLDGLPDFTRDQREIIVTSWAAMLDPESPWHAHIPELIAQGKSAPRPTLTYLIAHGILILLGSAVCVCFWKSIPRANAHQPLLPSPTDP